MNATVYRIVAACAALAVLGLAVPPVAAQAFDVAQDRQPPRSLGLAEAITLALQNNQQLRVAAFEVTIARAQLAQAKAAATGQVNAQASYTRVQEQAPTTITFTDHGALHTITLPIPSPNLYDVRLILQYPLYTGGRIEAQVALADANLKGTEASLERLKQQIVFEVRQAYYRLLLARSGMAVAERTTAQAAENLRVARARVTAGAAPRFDEVQAEVAVANARQGQVRARNGIAQATQLLNALLSLPLETPLLLRDSFVIEPVSTAVDALTAKSLEVRPELAEVKARQAAAAAAIQLAESGAKPTVGLSGVGSYSNTGGLLAGTTLSTNWSITLAATLNLYDGGITRERIQEARLRLEQLKALEAQQRQAVELEVRQAFLNLEGAQEELAGTDALVAQANEAQRIANVRFQSGVGTNLEVLSAQASSSQAEAGKAQALFSYSVARASLERAVGGPVQ